MTIVTVSKKAKVFIDGAYLSKISKHLGDGEYLNFDINQLAITLAKSQGLWCDSVYYYTAPPFQSAKPSAQEAELKANYDKFVSKLKRIPNFNVREGRCQRIYQQFKQKGVDTLLTMDLMSNSKNKNNDVFILLACDTDFVPILNQIRANGTTVILFYYSDFIRHSNFSMSNHILTACDRCVLIDKEHFDRSVKI